MAAVVAVGDIVSVPPLGVRSAVERIDIATHPSTDPKAELHHVEVEECELSAHCVLTLACGQWVYGCQVDAVLTAGRGES